MDRKVLRRAVWGWLTLLFAVPALVLLPGCSAFRSSTQEITVRTEPPDALVNVNGNIVASPATLVVPRNETMFIKISREGYFPYVTTVGHSLNVTGYLDIAGSIFILPIIGLFTPGKRSLDSTDFSITLIPTSTK